MTYLSENFTLEEFTSSKTAEQHGIDVRDYLQPIHRFRLKTLCESILEPIRGHFGKPVHVTSGFRPRPLNRLVGGSSTSLHKQAKAADIYVEDTDLETVFNFIVNSDLPYEETAIYENRGFIHVAFQNIHNPSRQVF